ncbi:MAG: ATP-binding protein [Propionicimonas sp.]|nr:ATP-binding protein [Propionicimonas sp.]
MGTPTPPELTAWVHRGVALFCLGSLVPAAFMAAGQIQYQAGWWLLVFGLGTIAVTIGMTLWSVAGRSVVWLARSYCVLILAAIATWPLGWTSSEPADGSPWLWMCLGVASVWAALTIGTQWGFIYAIVSGAVFAWVRLTPSGQAISLVSAMQDMLVLVINPSAVIIGISLLTDSIRRLNATLETSQQEQARAAVEHALVEERRRLDSIVHDEVMTTLVNAALTGTQRDPQVAVLAQHAIDQLETAGREPDNRVPVSVDHVAWLVEDVVSQLLPQARFRVELGDNALLVPASVASAIGQASREAAMNIARHAEADRVDVLIGDPAEGQAGVRVVVSDDGVGFDPTTVPSDRFGLQLSVLDRMQSVGGQVELRSAPGKGTTVELSWLSSPEVDYVLPPQLKNLREQYPALATMRGRTLAGLISLLISLHFVLGWTTLDQVTLAWPVFAAQALAVLATWLSLRDIDHNPLPMTSAIAVVFLLSATTLLVQSVLPMGRWPGYATWYSSVAMVILIVLLFRGRPSVAWTGVGLFVAESLYWAFTHGLGLGEVVRVSFGPVSWMIVAQLVSRWLMEIGTGVMTTQEASYTANQAIAESYSRLVLRDIWLRQLKTQVGPLLSTLADPTAPLTETDLETALATERRLRDGLRASNLLAEGTQDVVEAARMRGVEVTLVDSRGSALPEVVSKALKQSLTTQLSDRTVKKLVARAAPEGYDDVVTILTVRTDGRTEMLGLDKNGIYQSR